jgi:predicted NUDIX family NTP pyrophosphohydrolase
MPGPDRYAFDGSVAPWNVNHDEYMRRHAALGMKVLPYTFQTPRWLSRAPAGTAKNIAGHPPKVFADYGDMMFQLAARYGSAKHPEAALKTNDKLSGLGLVDTFQLWNEPNLEGPDWAPWVGTMDEFMEIFRVGAEAVKRADPQARVSPAGFAGIAVATVDSLYRYQYADGKRPVDFADVVSVHYYSGRQEPETATLDRNATRSGQAEPGAPTYPESLAQLLDWRDDHASGKPIWMTETGNDVGGPMGLGEREQGGKIPRVTMLALAAGIDKVFIYREKGSMPAQHAGSGLMRDDDSFRASWFTYATLIRQFQGVKPGRAWRIAHPSPDVWLHVWERDGAPLVTAWSVGGDVELGLDLGECEVVDAFGHAERRDAATLQLGYYPQYIGKIAKPQTLVPLVEAAKACEAARQERRRRDNQRKSVLFDFGSRQHVGSLNLGTVRPYESVLSEDAYDAARGWGFEPRAGLRDSSAHWMPDLLRKDSVRIDKNVSFRFRAASGTYRVTVLAQPLGQAVTLTLHAGDKSTPFAVVKGTDPQAVVLQTTGGDLTLSADGYVELQAISLVEEP